MIFNLKDLETDFHFTKRVTVLRAHLYILFFCFEKSKQQAFYIITG